METSGQLAGQLADWPSKARMAQILRDAGLRIVVGRFSIRVEDCSHFVFQEYGGDLGIPAIDADADTPEAMLHDGKLVSDALSKARIRHRFEIYDHEDNLVGYLHYDWPPDNVA